MRVGESPHELEPVYARLVVVVVLVAVVVVLRFETKGLADLADHPCLNRDRAVLQNDPLELTRNLLESPDGLIDNVVNDGRNTCDSRPVDSHGDTSRRRLEGCDDDVDVVVAHLTSRNTHGGHSDRSELAAHVVVDDLAEGPTAFV